MTRMSREFSLVLLGSGILTAGYFIAPDPAEALAEKADDQAAHRVGSSTYRSHYYGHYPILFLHGGGYSGSGSVRGRPMSATAGVTRGGLGGIGRSASVSS